jgi:hypothetical protein
MISISCLSASRERKTPAHNGHNIIVTDLKVRCAISWTAVGQEGRPIHSSVWRHPRTERLKLDLGWGAAYSAAGDLESERLFNYGLLAAPPSFHPIDIFTCFDTHMAGPGSPPVMQGTRPELLGHGKRLFVVNMACYHSSAQTSSLCLCVCPSTMSQCMQ